MISGSCLDWWERPRIESIQWWAIMWQPQGIRSPFSWWWQWAVGGMAMAIQFWLTKFQYFFSNEWLKLNLSFCQDPWALLGGMKPKDIHYLGCSKGEVCLGCWTRRLTSKMVSCWGGKGDIIILSYLIHDRFWGHAVGMCCSILAKYACLCFEHARAFFP